MPSRLFCFGLGYSAEAFVRRLLAGGWRVAGTVRTPTRLESLRRLGVDALTFDRDHPLPDGALDLATHVLVSIPPDDLGDPVLDACRPAIVAAGSRLRWLGYLSTTGVYGDHGGAWVDETTTTHPSSERSRRRALAETAWLDLHRRHDLPVHVFRLAGIYGPGRSPLDDLRSGTIRRIIKPGQVFSRIHVDDIAGVLAASIDRPNAGAIYNVCDDETAPPQDVVAYACRLLGMRPPPEIPFAEAQLSPMAQTFWADNKRVSNRRIHQELGVTLHYPTYREGLRALAEVSGQPG
jgi:nucleoside-diphosphate-sugar epimerase